MRRRTNTLALVMTVLLLVLPACNFRTVDSPSKPHANPPAERPASFPYKDLSASEVVSATVSIPPRGFQVGLSDSEIKELVAIMRTIEIDSPDKVEVMGKQTFFSFTMTNGTERNISAYENVIYIDGLYTIEYHETKAALILSEFGKRVAEEAYLRFLEKSTYSSMYASHDGPTSVKTGGIVIISLSETQSIPYRWKPDISDGSLIALVHDEVKSSGANPNNPPGSGGEIRTFYFEALRAGECTITMNNTYIGDESDIAGTETYTIIIENE